MMRGKRSVFGWGRVVLLTVIALAASVVPLPPGVDLFRPDFVALTVLWFCLLSPRRRAAPPARRRRCRTR
jgi:cell shape-determining protein MreD